MLRPITLPEAFRQSRAPRALARAVEPVSIHSAIHFEPEPNHAWLMDHAGGPDTRDARLELFDAMRATLKGMELGSGWWGSRAGGERAWGSVVDEWALRHGLARRTSAQLPAPRGIPDPAPDDDIPDDAIPDVAPPGPPADAAGVRPMSPRAARALRAAQDRATYRIGEGLLDAAKALHRLGLLDEARVIWGRERTRPARLVIRDAVFAAEDLTLEEMARILWNARAPADPDGFAMDGDTDDAEDEELGPPPLVFVQCPGVLSEFVNGPCHLVLEAVDFRSVECLEAVLTAARERSETFLRQAQEKLFQAYGKHRRGGL